MTKNLLRRSLAIAAAIGVIAGGALVGSASASAYQNTPGNVYTAQNPAACNKRPCVLYPKSAQLPSGRIVATFEDSESTVIGQTMPVYKSDDYGSTWQKLADVQAPAALSADPQYAKYTSNWTNPYLYVLPEAVGNLAAGTLLLASIVSGDDAYYNEQKAANPSWTPSGDGDRQDLALALFSSTDEGAHWNVVNVIAQGGWQGGSAGAIGRTSVANTYKQVDPIWEPYLMAYQGQLVAYYSDENDYLGYDASTGIPIIDPDNSAAADSGGQILVHKTWDGTSAAWSAPVVDIAGLTQNRGNGKFQIGGGRPGMETVVPTADGKWLVTYEYFGGGDNVHFKIATDPLKFYAAGDADGDNISLLPTIGPKLAVGGSPVLTKFPDGRIVYNAAGSGSVWVNESGRSDGTWKAYQTPMPSGYSRNLHYVEGTGRLLILQAAWAGGSTGPVKFGEVDLGRSDGAYYSLINRQTGQLLSPEADKTQDANLTGNTPDIITWANNPANTTQRWHLTPKGTSVSFLNRAGGRSIGVWNGSAVVGQRVAQWVDDGGSDKLWNLVPTSDGYYKIQSAKNTAVYMTGAIAGGAVDLRASINAAANPVADDAQEWRLVQEAPTAASLTDRTYSTALIAPASVQVGASVELNAATHEPVDVRSHANASGHIYAFAGTAPPVDLGVVQFDADEKATITLAPTFGAGTDLKVAVLFDATPTLWDSVTVNAPEPVVVTAAVSAAAPANAAGWFSGPVNVALTDNSATATVEYRIGDTGDWLPVTGPVAVTGQGSTTVNYRATEGGTPITSSVGSIQVKIDSAAPTTSAAVSPASGVAAFGSTVTATFAATDATSGVASTEYSTDGGTTWVPATDAGVSFSTVGEHDVKYRSTDIAGNVEPAKDITLSVAEPVVVTAVVTGAAPANAAGWFSGPENVALTDNSTTATVEYRLGDTGDWLPVTGPVAVTDEGVTTVNYRATDRGTPIATSVGSVQVQIDTAAPKTLASVDPASGVVTVGSTVTATFTATDATSGVASTEYSIDGGTTWVAATDAGVSFSTLGAHVVKYRSVDVAGNVETAKEVTLTVAEPVVVTAAVSGAAPANAAGWFSGPVNVTLTDNSATATVEYRLGDTGDWLPVTGPVAVTGQGVTTVNYRATDGGTPIAESVGDVTVKIDSATPTTSAAVHPASGVVTVGSTITATFTATDATSSVASTEYSTDGGTTWTPATDAGVSFSTAGAHVVKYRSTDVAGNVETANQITLTVAEPQATAQVTLSSTDTSPVDGWYQQAVKVTLKAPDASYKVQYRLNGGTWKTYSAAFTISTSGTTTVDHRLTKSGVPVAGSDVQTLVKIDKSLPVALIGRAPAVSSGTVLNPISVGFAATDTYSGVDRQEYQVNGGGWLPAGPDPLVLNTVGSYSITSRAYDKAGNVSAVKTLSTITIKANPTPAVKPSVTSAKRGAAITLTITGFARWDDVAVTFAGADLGTVITDVNGKATVTIRVPADAALGAATIVATGSSGSPTASTKVTVKP